MTTKDQRILKVTRASIFIIGACITIYGYAMYFIDNYIPNKAIQAIAIFIILSITLVLLYSKRERIFNSILSRIWHPNEEVKKLLGQWKLAIFFNNNVEADRNGLLTFEDTYSGLEIRGGNIQDKEGKKTVDQWISQFAETRHYEDHTTLIYQYLLQDTKERNKYSKLGIVIAVSNEDGVFKGTFKDIILENGEIERYGTVLITKCEPT